MVKRTKVVTNLKTCGQPKVNSCRQAAMSTAATTTTPAANGATASTSLNNTLRLVSFLKEKSDDKAEYREF